MKVYGQLEKAQLENLASTNPTPGSQGRVYLDVSVPAAPVPKMYLGSAWVPFNMGQPTALISQNSGTAVTVDWSKGLFQQVVLTGHCTISFANPLPGAIHTLTVTQRATEVAATTPYVFRLNLIDQDPRRSAYQPQSVIQSSENQVFAWLYAAGIRPAYATVPAFATDLNTGLGPNPSALVTDYHPTLPFVIMGASVSPFYKVIKFQDMGQKFSWIGQGGTQDTIAVAMTAVKFHPDGHSLFFGTGTTPFIKGKVLDALPQLGVFSTYADPATLPTGAVASLDVHPSGSHVIVGHATTPFMSCYPITQIGLFGAKIANPSTLPAAAVTALAFSPTGDYLATGGGTTPFLQVWAFDPNTGFGAISTAPGSLPAGALPSSTSGKAIAWRPQGDFIAVALTVSPYIAIYAFNRSTGAFGANVVTLAGGNIPQGTLTSVQFSPDGQYLVAGTGATPWVYVWDFSTLTLASAAIGFDVAPSFSTAVSDIAFSPSGDFFTCVSTSSPYLRTYPTPRKVRNYLKLND